MATNSALAAHQNTHARYIISETMAAAADAARADAVLHVPNRVMNTRLAQLYASGALLNVATGYRHIELECVLTLLFADEPPVAARATLKAYVAKFGKGELGELSEHEVGQLADRLNLLAQNAEMIPRVTEESLDVAIGRVQILLEAEQKRLDVVTQPKLEEVAGSPYGTTHEPMNEDPASNHEHAQEERVPTAGDFTEETVREELAEYQPYRMAFTHKQVHTAMAALIKLFTPDPEATPQDLFSDESEAQGREKQQKVQAPPTPHTEMKERRAKALDAALMADGEAGASSM